MTVSPAYGVMGIHIWKDFPTRKELQDLLVNSIEITRNLGFEEILIESPLLAKDDRHAVWDTMLKATLVSMGYRDVEVVEIPIREMGIIPSLMFQAVRRFKQFDKENKHLPDMKGWRLLTAGFRLKV